MTYLPPYVPPDSFLIYCNDVKVYDAFPPGTGVETEDWLRRFTAPQPVPISSTTLGRWREHVVKTTSCEVPDVPMILYSSTRNHTSWSNPASIFHEMWDEGLIDSIDDVSITRVFGGWHVDGNERIASDFSDEAAHHYFKRDMFSRFCSIILLMGQLPLPKESDYWKISISGDSFAAQVINTIHAAMNYDEYAFIRRNICFNDPMFSNDISSPNRMNWVCERIFANGRSMYSPSRHNTFDDQSFPFHGRFCYVKGKRSRKCDPFAITYDSLNDSNGFTLGMKMIGKSKGSISAEQDDDDDTSDDVVATPDGDIGLISNRVLRLVRECLPNPSGHHIIMDNEYSHPVLFDELAKIGVLATGTVKANTLKFSAPEMRRAKRFRRGFPTGIC